MIQLVLYLFYSAVALLLLLYGLPGFLFPRFRAWFSLTRLAYRILMALLRRQPKPPARWRIHWKRLEGLFCILLAVFWLVNLHPEIRLLPRPLFDPVVHAWQPEHPDGTEEERQDLERLNQAVCTLLKPALMGNSAGICIGALHGDRAYILGVGRKDLSETNLPDGDTVFEIGSITKTFTCAILASLAGEGSVSLDDSVASFLPGWTIPERDGRKITLKDLATHRSGLPRMPDTPMPGAILDTLQCRAVVDPYRNGTAEYVRGFLAEYLLPRAPGSRDEYSNLGVGLLGYALSQKAGQSYESLLRQRILEPLGMADTVVTLTAEGENRLAQGYIGPLALGKVGLVFPMGPWTFADGFQGCGAIKSTVRDMLKYLRANIAAPDGPLGAELARIQEPQYDVEDLDKCKVGLGMFAIEIPGLDDPMYWHNGGTGGYCSFMGFSKKYRVGVVMLCTGACDEALGHEIIKALAKGR